MIKGTSKLYGVLGWPVNHSLSPKIHNTAFNHFNIDAVYVAFSVHPDSKNAITQSLTTLNVSGANITVPYKSDIIKQLDFVDPYALTINSVNTILRKVDKWYGFSTDGAGFLKALAKIDLKINSQKFLLLGAGGAAKAIAFALAQSGAAAVYIKNRQLFRAESLVSNLRQQGLNAEVYQSGTKFDVLINATSLGLHDDNTTFFDDFLPQASTVVDIVYKPGAQTSLVKKAANLGKVVQDGLPMLIYQALEAFKIWTNVTVPYKLIAQALDTK